MRYIISKMTDGTEMLISIGSIEYMASYGDLTIVGLKSGKCLKIVGMFKDNVRKVSNSHG